MKNKIKYITIGISILVSLTLLISCYGELNETGIEKSTISFGEYLKDMSVLKGKGTILIQSNEFEINQKFEKNIDISQREGAPNTLKIYDSEGNNINILECNNNLTSKKNFFGNDLKYKINDGELSKIYIPNLLKIDYESRTINNGSQIKWNADSNNKKGIILWLSYSPLDQVDMRIISNHRKIITHGLTTEDNGLYTITEDDLERFPKKSVLCLNIARTNYTISDSGKPSLIAFTTVCKNVGYTN